MSRRLLIICPHFAPTNAADGHRVRICAKGLMARGWQLEILACEPDDLDINQSPALTDTLPQGLTIHRVPCRPGWLGKLAGATTTSRNGLRFIKAKGDELLAEGRFDGILFSTTAFGLLPLASRWQARFRVPYVIDLQDPWVQVLPDGVRPPGGAIRYALAMAGARRAEPKVIGNAAGVVSVSPSYQSQLAQRYPGMSLPPFLSLPFGASQQDLELARSAPPGQRIFSPDRKTLNLVHVGRGGEDLWASLAPLLLAIKDHPAVKLRLIGTSYAPPDRQLPSLSPLAEELGVADQVTEYPARIDYFQALRCLADSSAIVVLTSSDMAYNASKIHNCVLAGPPVLALVHPGSVASEQWAELAPHLTLIDCQSSSAREQVAGWLGQLPASPTSLNNYPFEADQQAAKLSKFLAHVLSPSEGASEPD